MMNFRTFIVSILPLQHIPTPWPAPEILNKLVHNSSGYLVYAATIIKFVDDEYSWPSKQLDTVVQNLIPHDSESPFATLDQLYMQILSRVPVRDGDKCDGQPISIMVVTRLPLL
jgi:hypothetical protein